MLVPYAEDRNLIFGVSTPHPYPHLSQGEPDWFSKKRWKSTYPKYIYIALAVQLADTPEASEFSSVKWIFATASLTAE